MSSVTAPTRSGDRQPDQTTGAGSPRTERVSLAAAIRGRLHTVQPKHWTVLLAQVAAGSFLVLVLSGIYLELFYDPSMAGTVYTGPYRDLQGVPVSHAYNSTLAIS